MISVPPSVDLSWCKLLLSISAVWQTDAISIPQCNVSSAYLLDCLLSSVLHVDLYWLDVADCVCYKLDVTIHRCLHNKAPWYLVDCCVPVPDITSRQRLRSARLYLLTVPRHRRSTFGHRTFSVAGPTVWNLLSDQLTDTDCANITPCSHWSHSSSTSISRPMSTSISKPVSTSISRPMSSTLEV